MKNILWWIAGLVLVVIALQEGWALELFGSMGIYVCAFIILSGIGVFIRYIIQKRRMKKDAHTIVADSEDYLAAVVDLAKNGASYRERLDYLRSKNISKQKAEQILANAIMPAGNTPATAEYTPIEQFLENTYHVWKSGKAARFSPAFAAEARTATLPGFLNIYRKTLSDALGAYFEHEQLKKGEFLLCIIDEGFLLTNLRLYIFHPKLPQSRTIFLSDLHQFKSKGVWTKSFTATLKTGEEISLSGLDSCVDPGYVNRLILEPVV